MRTNTGRGARSTIRSVVAAGAVLATTGALVASATGPAAANPIKHDTVVSANPINNTPDLSDGTVWDVVRMGPDRYIAAGTFTRAVEKGTGTALSRPYLVEFNSSTGHVYRGFAPKLNGSVQALWPSSDGNDVFVGGYFTSVNGKATRYLTKLDVDTGAADPDFTPPSLDGGVRDLTITDDMLVVGGAFKNVGGSPHRALVALKRGDGSRLSFFDGVSIAGLHYAPHGGTTELFDMDPTPDGSRLVLVGNWATVNGQQRNQVAQLDLTGSKAALVDWRLPLYAAPCGPHYDAPIRDVSVSPSGTYAAIVATGGKHGGSLCDAAARFELGSRGDVKPTWTNFTGGDTLSAVEVTGAAVYVGGHQRWLSNPKGNDSAGPGAVPREGIGALDRTDGKVLSWNPGKTRGVGVRVIRAQASGIWVGSDSCRIGGEQHCRVAAFPLP